MKTYSGRRTEHGCAVTVTDANGRHDLNPRLDLRCHSEEFEWGYGGSGPAQLALALAADVLDDDETALAVYQKLKFRVVGKLPTRSWTLTADELEAVIRTLLDSAAE